MTGVIPMSEGHNELPYFSFHGVIPFSSLDFTSLVVLPGYSLFGVLPLIFGLGPSSYGP